MSHRPINRHTTLPSRRLVSASARAGSEKAANPTGGNDRRQPFVEDFNMEHSSAYPAAVYPVAMRSSYAMNPHSPSCVYLG